MADIVPGLASNPWAGLAQGIASAGQGYFDRTTALAQMRYQSMMAQAMMNYRMGMVANGHDRANVLSNHDLGTNLDGTAARDGNGNPIPGWNQTQEQIAAARQYAAYGNVANGADRNRVTAAGQIGRGYTVPGDYSATGYDPGSPAPAPPGAPGGAAYNVQTFGTLSPGGAPRTSLIGLGGFPGAGGGGLGPGGGMPPSPSAGPLTPSPAALAAVPPPGGGPGGPGAAMPPGFAGFATNGPIPAAPSTTALSAAGSVPPTGAPGLPSQGGPAPQGGPSPGVINTGSSSITGTPSLLGPAAVAHNRLMNAQTNLTDTKNTTQSITNDWLGSIDKARIDDYNANAAYLKGPKTTVAEAQAALDDTLAKLDPQKFQWQKYSDNQRIQIALGMENLKKQGLSDEDAWRQASLGIQQQNANSNTARVNGAGAAKGGYLPNGFSPTEDGSLAKEKNGNLTQIASYTKAFQTADPNTKAQIKQNITSLQQRNNEIDRQRNPATSDYIVFNGQRISRTAAQAELARRQGKG